MKIQIGIIYKKPKNVDVSMVMLILKENIIVK